MTIDQFAAAGIGFVIAYIVMMFIVRLKESTVQGLGSVIALIAGGAVTNYLNASLFSYYFIGVLIGFVFYWIIFFLSKGTPPLRQ
ncbi:MAG: hypothetical protein FJ150_07220 [Euryarchaeota archaeon]|nr:hypothetical protein [Euryarchaeota archaeon]